MALFVWLTFFLTVTVFNPSMAISDETIYIAQKIMLAYEKLLTYVNKYAAMLNLGVMYGVVLAEAQLEMMGELPLNNNILSDITTLKWRTHYVVDILRNYVTIPKGSHEIIFSLMDFRAWRNNASLCSNKIAHLGKLSWNISHIKSSLMNGLPHDLLSDECITEVIRKGPFRKLHECKFNSEYCKEVYENVEESNGYPLTHKVLYWQTAKAVNCINSITVDEYIRKLCSRIYAEAKSNDANGFPFLAMDLFLKQVALCGREGYAEFLNKRWAETILKWQTTNGCYGFPPTTESRDKRQSLRTSHIRSKRDSSTVAFKCDVHMTGVAAAAMMTMLRNFVTEPEWNICTAKTMSRKTKCCGKT